MARIRSKDTQPEMLVRHRLHAAGLRYRLHVKSLPGTPDLALPRHRTIVNVHGCFWHAHQECRYFRWPSSHRDAWAAKLIRNVERDRASASALRAAGWSVLTVWECELRQDPDARCNALISAIRHR